MSKTCGKCGGTDFTPAGICRPCKKAANDAYRGKMGGSVTRAKKKQTSVTVTAPAPAAKLVIEQGYGILAWIEDPYLFLQQTDASEDRTDTLCLSRTEFRQLLAQFKDFAS